MHPHHLAKDLRDRLSSVVRKSKDTNERLQSIQIKTSILDEETKQVILQELIELRGLMTNLIGDANGAIRNAKFLTKHIHNRQDKVSLYGMRGDIQGNAYKLIAELQGQLNRINNIITNLGLVSGHTITTKLIVHLDDLKEDHQKMKKSFAQVQASSRPDMIQMPERPRSDAADLIAGLIMFTGIMAKMLQKYSHKLKS